MSVWCCQNLSGSTKFPIFKSHVLHFLLCGHKTWILHKQWLGPGNQPLWCCVPLQNHCVSLEWLLNEQLLSGTPPVSLRCSCGSSIPSDFVLPQLSPLTSVLLLSLTDLWLPYIIISPLSRWNHPFLRRILCILSYSLRTSLTPPFSLCAGLLWRHGSIRLAFTHPFPLCADCRGIIMWAQPHQGRRWLLPHSQKGWLFLLFSLLRRWQHMGQFWSI